MCLSKAITIHPDDLGKLAQFATKSCMQNAWSIDGIHFWLITEGLKPKVRISNKLDVLKLLKDYGE